MWLTSQIQSQSGHRLHALDARASVAREKIMPRNASRNAPRNALRIAPVSAVCFATASALALAAMMTNTRAMADADEAVLHTHYDGVTNDLLTAGLGKSGLGAATAPTFV